MLYKNLSTKELYASIPSTSFIAEMFKKGIEMGSTQLAISAMEELITRGDTDIITYELDNVCKNGNLKLGTSMSTMIARSLTESCREADPLLVRYGKAIFKGEGAEGPLDWVKSGKAKKYFGGDIPKEIMG